MGNATGTAIAGIAMRGLGSFAEIEDVWKDASTYGAEAPPSPELLQQGRRAPACKGRPAGSGGIPAASCAEGDPLCDLFNKGYSSVIDEMIDTYTVGDFYDKAPQYTRSEPPRSAVAKREEFEPSEGWGGAGGAAFQQLAPDVRLPLQLSPYANADADVGAAVDGGNGAKVGAGAAARPPPLHPEPAEPHGPAPAAASHGAAEDEDKDAAWPPRGGARAVDLALYVLSGVLLIFIMEQFVQMGARMRYYY